VIPARAACRDSREATDEAPPERVERVTMLDEHLRAGRLGAAAPDVVDDRPADVV
jgi:hypothetical protein